MVEFVEGRCVRISDNHEMITTGYSNITPWDSPRELDEPQLRERIDAMFAEVEDPPNLLAVLHPPPWGTDLDKAPELTERPGGDDGGQRAEADVGGLNGSA